MSEIVHCSKCGEECCGATRLLAHILSEHQIVDAKELNTDD